MNVPIINVPIEPVLALVIGILILLVPRLLNYLVAVYLIAVGILGLRKARVSTLDDSGITASVKAAIYKDPMLKVGQIRVAPSREMNW